MSCIRKIFNKVCENLILQSIIVVILFLPLIATLGQYMSSGFIMEKISVAILYWPGISTQFRIMLPVSLTIGAILISYVIGISYMYKRKALVKVILIGLISMIIAQFIGSIFNSFTGWHEIQSVSDFGKLGDGNVINRLIFSSWHDPVWEEIVFTGIPLIMLNIIKEKTTEKIYKIGIISYFLVPSIAMAVYHIPNHGLARIADTLIIHTVTSWMALRYSFFAPLVLHYIEDTLIIISLDKVKGLPINEMNWIFQNSSILNSIFATSLISFLVLIPVLGIWYIRKEKEQNKRQPYFKPKNSN